MRKLLFLLILICHAAYSADARITAADLLMRADAGDRTAMRTLADGYYAGVDGLEQNFAKAAEWYRRLARSGDVRAQTSLGLMYARGYGVEKNMREAFRLWNFAALQNDPGAQFNLGVTYLQGEGIAAEAPRAAHWFREAAKRGHVQAQRNLALMCFHGNGVNRDLQQAYFWMKVAALQGDEDSEKSLSAIIQEMQQDQREEADKQAQDWMAKNRRLEP